MLTVCHFTSAHPPYDGRIFYKECVSLAKAGYEVYLVIPNAKDEIIEGVHIVGVQVNNGNRFCRILLTANAICKKALSLNADIYHFHDPDPGASRRASGCITSESISSKSHPNLYYGKYHSDSVYSALYPSDF